MPTNSDKKITTMRDIARVAGVSRMTVSRALKKDGLVSKETRDHVLRVVREMNYVPDQMAGSLTTKKSGFVAVLVPSLNNLHFAETVQALTEELALADLQILLGYTNYSAEREEELVETMLRRRPEAIVLSYDGHSERTVALLNNAQVPVVELWERPKAPIMHTIGFSNQNAAAMMTDELMRLGYRNITFLAEAGDDWTRGAARRVGYQMAVEAAGRTPQVFQIGKPPLSIEDGAGATGALLEQFPQTDCVFCVSDAAAFGVQSALKLRGISVPDMMGVAGFGNFEVSRFASPTISTVVVDPVRIGREAGRLIAGVLTTENGSAEQLHIDAEPVVGLRNSTKPQN